MCRGRLHQITVLEGDVVLGEVDYFDQAKALLGTVEPEAETVGGEGQRDGLFQGFLSGVSQVQLRELLRFSFETCENIVERGSENCARTSSAMHRTGSYWLNHTEEAQGPPGMELGSEQGRHGFGERAVCYRALDARWALFCSRWAMSSVAKAVC